MQNLSEIIKNCRKCRDLTKLTCDIIKRGKSRFLVLGESPAKDGWIQSGRAFYNSKGQFQATGKVLERLLNIIGLSIDDINFTECCKCIIDDRKRLRDCTNNCKDILFKQIAEFKDADIILPMGQFPTEAILGTKINKLSDYVGREFEINFNGVKKIVIPIYHTSPASPLSYKGNLSIFENLRKYL